jgi:predicted Rossmann fold flavoprotein
VVGAGAAGLATAIFARRANPSLNVVLIESARRPGAKILVSGGGRCNVTNATVTDADFWGGRRTIIRRVIRSFPVRETVDFFRHLGVTLHEEADGKMFPDSGRARDVLQALLDEVERSGATLVAGTRVLGIERDGRGFRLDTSRGNVHAARIVLATGGQSLPKSGSDGAGYTFARRFGHTIVPTTPALVPLLLGGDERSIHRALAGVSHPAELMLRVEGAMSVRLTGSLLWTHVGISGPVTLNLSRHWLRARLDGRPAELSMSFVPGRTFEEIDVSWAAPASRRGSTMQIGTALGALLPASVAAAIPGALGVDGAVTLAHVTRENRRRLSHALTGWPLDVTGSRGYTYAEATAGGVALDEIDPETMESRVAPGLFLVGEILDVDGRIGGFNFQWAWSSAHVAAAAVGA